ncbi:MAG: hypothetical protein A3F11_01345 [Gammaproteobacteria bacterium RIFCSPHIGHO2_12_FULL_37_14]|nr:MAG: hypothetical protein A3F11_01345 [Gammaproteobacteria bacterium RIFCSPHIGHO2_12_FULL_37_14]
MSDKLLSHSVNPEGLQNTIDNAKSRILSQENVPIIDMRMQLELLDQLTQFDFGKFLLQHQGLNGYWTHYALTHPWVGKKTEKNNRNEPISILEKFMLEKAPVVVATQERFQIFLNENQKSVKNNAVLATIPCGMMGELLYLNYDNINNIKLIGIDYDKNTLNDAKSLAEKQKLSQYTQFIEKNAWDLCIQNEFDLISSNGLNIYEPDDQKVTQLYKAFYDALKPGGKLVTSFLTMSPQMSDQFEWNMSEINQDDLLLQKTIFADIIQSKWQCYRSTQKTQQQLESRGFKDIHFIYDRAKIFPTVVAVK